MSRNTFETFYLANMQMSKESEKLRFLYSFMVNSINIEDQSKNVSGKYYEAGFKN